MCPTVKLIILSVLLAGVAVVSPTNERSKRYAQEPQGSSSPNLGTNPPPSPLERIFSGVSDRFDRMRDRLDSRYSTSTSRSPLRDWVGQRPNGSPVLDQLLRRINATWGRRMSRSNGTIPSRNLQLLRDLLHLRNASSSNERTRIDECLRRIFSDLRQLLSGSNTTSSSRNMQELRELIRQRIVQHQNGTQGLDRIMQRIQSILNQRYSGSGRIPSGGRLMFGGGSLSTSGSAEGGRRPGGISTSGNPPTSGEGSPSTSGQSGSASGSAESGNSSGAPSSGSGESADTS